MIETPFFFRCGANELFAVAHEPAAVPSGHAFVFCHPPVEEKLWAHRVFVSFARLLAARGDAVLRFDFSGNGDSGGAFSDWSVEGALAEVSGAAEQARRRWPQTRLTLLGLRFGATIAALAAEQIDDITRLVLWAPVVDGERYMQELLRTNLATQTAVYREVRYDRAALVEQMRAGAAVNVDGYPMGYALYSQAAAIKLASATRRHQGPCLVVHVDRQPGRVPAELQQLARAYPQATLVQAREEPFWREIQTSYLCGAPNLGSVTAAWLDGQPPDTTQP